MVADTLVAEWIDAGAVLIRNLRAGGFPITVGFWLKTSEEGEWFFYLVSPEVDNAGLAAAYRHLHAVLQGTANQWIRMSDITLIGERNPIARDALDFYQHFSGTWPVRYGGRQLGGVLIDEAYFYARK